MQADEPSAMDQRRRPIRPLLVAAVAILVAGLASLPVVGAPPAAAPTGMERAAALGIVDDLARFDHVPPGLAQVANVPLRAADALLGIAVFDGGPPDAVLTSALEALGVQVQPMRRLPLAFVQGTAAQLVAAVAGGLAVDVFPNRALEYYSSESNAAVGADAVHRDTGLTGAGVGVAIVDSGIDATQPALADHVTHNAKLLSAEYVNMPGLQLADPRLLPAIALPTDATPYDNSDLGSGHGTHVAGIVAGDGTGDPRLLGVAPDAHLIGYGTGDVLFITSVIAAYDDILVHQHEWDIEVINNSWGSGFGLFDPADPINLATRAAHDAGITVVFAAGNSTEPMTVNPHSVAPWVISVASATTSAQRSDFSSRGIPYDGTAVATVERPSSPLTNPDQHLHFDGDGLGIYHPDVAAPGTDILSVGTPTGAAVQMAPDGTAVASGTSMASPHVAGLAALLLQARPGLTPDEVRLVLQRTARPMADGSAFWEAGHGFIDAAAAVALVRDPSFDPAALVAAEQAQEAAVRAQRPWSVLSTDMYAFEPLPVSVGGLDGRTYEIEVGQYTDAVQALVAFPTTEVVGINLFEWVIEVRDSLGDVVGRSEVSDVAGAAGVLIDIDELPRRPRRGTWTVTVSGSVAARDFGMLLGRMVTVNVAQLQRQSAAAPGQPTFVPDDSPLRVYLAPQGEPGGLPTPEGCALDGGVAAQGVLTAAPPSDSACRAALAGYASSYALGSGSVFLGDPLPEAVTVGGTGELALHLVDSLQPVWGTVLGGGVSVQLDAVAADGTVQALTSADGDVSVGPAPTRSTYPVPVPAATVPAGSRLRLTVRISGIYTSTLRLLYGGGSYADGGLTLQTGTLL